jgi:hypothetical protein
MTPCMASSGELHIFRYLLVLTIHAYIDKAARGVTVLAHILSKEVVQTFYEGFSPATYIFQQSEALIDDMPPRTGVALSVESSNRFGAT